MVVRGELLRVGVGVGSMLRIQRDSARNILRRVFGIQGGTGPEELEEGIRTVCEVGRRGEFDLLLEQGIVPWQAFRARTPAAGQFAHCYAMATNANIRRAYHAIVERVEFAGAGATTIAGFVGTVAGASGSALVVSRDARFTRAIGADFSNLVQVQDGETAAALVGQQIWQGRQQAANGLPIVWQGPQLLRHISQSFGVQDQLAFQHGTAAIRIEYTFYGYLVPLVGIS